MDEFEKDMELMKKKIDSMTLTPDDVVRNPREIHKILMDAEKNKFTVEKGDRSIFIRKKGGGEVNIDNQCKKMMDIYIDSFKSKENFLKFTKQIISMGTPPEILYILGDLTAKLDEEILKNEQIKEMRKILEEMENVTSESKLTTH